MYYRKYFSGTIERSYSESVEIENVSGTSKYTVYPNQTAVLLNAIKETLEDCGCEVEISHHSINIDGCYFHLYYTGTSHWAIYIPYYSSACVDPSTGVSYQPFSGLNYQFYVTIKGEPKSFMEIYIGTYDNPAKETQGFFLLKANLIKNNEPCFFLYNIATTSTIYLRPRHADGVCSLVENYTGSNVSPPVSSQAQYAINISTASTHFSYGKNYRPLIPATTWDGYFLLPGCFYKYSDFNNFGSFYQCEEGTFYIPKQSIYMMVKCITEPHSS